MLFRYQGSFLQTVVDFMIVAFVIFIAVKGINRLKKPAALRLKSRRRENGTGGAAARSR
jgi:large-conductance mechanosensitive channel